MKKIIITAAMSAYLISQSVFALPNGKPFQELNSLIQENSTAIDANGQLIQSNSDAIIALSADFSVLNDQVNELNVTVYGDPVLFTPGLVDKFNDLENIVRNNKNEIDLALARIKTTEESIRKNAAAVAAVELEISAAQNNLTTLNSTLLTYTAIVDENVSVIAGVRAELDNTNVVFFQKEAQLQALIDSNTVGIEQTQEYIILVAEVATLREKLKGLTASLASLEATLESNNLKVSQVQADITAVELELTTLVDMHTSLVQLAASGALTDTEFDAFRAEIMQLITEKETNIALAEEQLDALVIEMSSIANQSSSLSNDLVVLMHSLSLLVDSDSSSITALQTLVSILSNTLTAFNAQYNLFDSQYKEIVNLISDMQESIISISEQLTQIANNTLSIENIFTGIVYSENFVFMTGYNSTTPQYQNWVAFQASLNGSTFGSVEFHSSNGGGAICNDSIVATQLATALSNNTHFDAACNGFQWATGNCGSGNELSINTLGFGTSCTGSALGAIRPLISNSSWGGMSAELGGSGSTVGSQTQSLTVVFK